MRSTTVALIIPAYNEEQTIRETIQSFYELYPGLHIYVIDNNSKDDTFDIAQRYFAESGAKGRVLCESLQGKALAVRRAFMEVEADIYVMVDADMTYSPKHLLELIRPIVAGEADMVVGDRLSEGLYAQENKRPFHNFGNKLVKGLINTLFRAKLNDIMTGYRAFSRQFVKTYPISCKGFELETEVTLHALSKNFRLKEVPIVYKDRPDGSESKLNTYSDGFKIIKKIFWIFKDYKPLVFFGGLSLMSLALGLLAGTPVIIEYIRTQWVHHIPLAILATGLVILGFIFFTIGMVLDTVVKLGENEYYLTLMQQSHGERPEFDEKSFADHAKIHQESIRWN